MQILYVPPAPLLPTSYPYAIEYCKTRRRRRVKCNIARGFIYIISNVQNKCFLTFNVGYNFEVHLFWMMHMDELWLMSYYFFVKYHIHMDDTQAYPYIYFSLIKIEKEWKWIKQLKHENNKQISNQNKDSFCWWCMKRPKWSGLGRITPAERSCLYLSWWC